MDGYWIGTVQFLFNDDGSVRQTRAHIRQYDGTVIDMKDGNEVTKQSLAIALRDFLAAIDP